MLAIAAVKDYEISHLDVSTAFLNGNLPECVYMEQPEAFEDGTDDVLELHKSLYGLKQSPREWYKELTHTMLELGFKKSDFDSSLFILEHLKGDFSVGVYVDDMVVLSKEKEWIDAFFAAISQKYVMKNLGPITKILGIHVRRDRNQRKIWIDQEMFTKDIISKYGFKANKQSIPALTSVKLVSDAPNDPAVEPGAPYREAVGSLLYLAQGTRPDIAFAVGVVSRFLANPRISHWTAVNHIGEYLANTITNGIVYGGENDSLQLTGYSDADWGDDPETRRSVSGYVFKLAGGAISWHSKRQQLVAKSSTEAEYVAASEAAAEGVWIRGLLNELECLQIGPTKILEDNAGARYHAKNDCDHSRMKHLDIRHHFIRDRIDIGQIELIECSTHNMAADMFTKALGRNKFRTFCEMIGLYQQAEVLNSEGSKVLVQTNTQ